MAKQSLRSGKMRRWEMAMPGLEVCGYIYSEGDCLDKNLCLFKMIDMIYNILLQ